MCIRDRSTVNKHHLSFQNVTFAYPDGEEAVLKNISFEATEGETIAFIGSTGSGKSTLINLIPRFYDVSNGKIEIDVYKRQVLNTFVEEVAKAHLPVAVMQTGCIGMCALEPIVEIFDKDNQKTTYVLVDEKKAKDIVLRHLIHGEVIDEYTVGHYSK